LYQPTMQPTTVIKHGCHVGSTLYRQQPRYKHAQPCLVALPFPVGGIDFTELVITYLHQFQLPSQLAFAVADVVIVHQLRICAAEGIADGRHHSVCLDHVACDHRQRHLGRIDELHVRDPFLQNTKTLRERDVLLMVDVDRRPVQAVEGLARCLPLGCKRLTRRAHFRVELDRPNMLVAADDSIPSARRHFDGVMVAVEIVVMVVLVVVLIVMVVIMVVIVVMVVIMVVIVVIVVPMVVLVVIVMMVMVIVVVSGVRFVRRAHSHADDDRR